MRQGSDALVLTTGITLKTGLDAAAMLEEQGVSAGVLHVHTVKPLDVDGILEQMANVRAVVAVEEHTVIGGLGSAVAEIIAEAGFDPAKRFKRVGLPDVFPDQYGSQDSLMARYSITAEELARVTRGLTEGRPNMAFSVEA